MTSGPYTMPVPKEYTLATPPKPVGHWVLYAESSQHLSFSMYHKPNRIQRWFTNKLLGWTWKDA
jgi:hypothetical protein